LTKEEKKYLKRFKEVIHKIISLHKSGMTEKNITEYLKENAKLKNEFDSLFKEKEDINFREDDK